jgi:hypothetical protein
MNIKQLIAVSFDLIFTALRSGTFHGGLWLITLHEVLTHRLKSVGVM